MPVPATKRSSSIELYNDSPKEGAKGTNWLRVLAGAAIIVGGMALADQARLSAEKGESAGESSSPGNYLSS